MSNATGSRWRKPIGYAFAGLVAFGLTGSALAMEQTEVQVGLTNAADGIQGRTALVWSDITSSRTNGAIDIKVFPAGQLGKGKTQIEGMIAGTHQVFVHISQYTGKVPEVRFWDLPFLFTDIPQLTRVIQGGMERDLEKVFNCHGMEYLATWGYGFRQITLRTKPIRTPEDFVGVKHRIPGGKAKQMMFEAFGADPSTIAFPELYQALKAGVADSQDNPLDTIYTSKFHEVTSYLSALSHVYNPNLVAGGKIWWDKLDPEAQNEIKTTARMMEGWSLQQNIIDDIEALNKIKEAAPDLEINYMNPDDLPAWREAAKPVYDAFREETSDAWADAVFKVVEGGGWDDQPDDKLPSCM